MKMQDVVHEIAIGEEIRGALLGEKNKLREYFRSCREVRNGLLGRPGH